MRYSTSSSQPLPNLSASSPPHLVPTAAQPGQSGITDAFGNGSGPTAGTQSTNTSFNPSSFVEDSDKPEVMALIERKAEHGFGYIVYMRFAKRTEGAKDV